MSKSVQVAEAEYLEPADYNRFGEFPQAALDDIVNDVIGYPAHWSGFTVSIKSAQELTVTPGRYFEGKIVYSTEVAEDLNLTIHFPLSASNEKWVAILAKGRVVEINENRAIETSEDPETSIPVDQSVPVIEHREVWYFQKPGLEGPAPATLPTIADNEACVAFVRVTTTGIQEIIPGNEWRAKTLHEVEGRVTAIELRIDTLFEETESLRTDLASVASKIETIPDPRLFAQMVRDSARHNQRLNLPDEARNYFFDQALLKDFWDIASGLGGVFRIDEGIRFQYAQQFDHTMRLLNYDDPAISVFNNTMVLPAYVEKARITSATGSGKKDISNVVHTVTTAVQHTVAHERVRYGPTINVCENTAGWGGLGNAAYGAKYSRGGETFINRGVNSNPWNQTATAQNGHLNFSVQKVIRDTYYTSYTTYHTETFGLSGATHGQTFLSSQVMVVTSIDLNFTKVGDTGDVTLSLCKVNQSGAPDFNAVLAHTTVAQADLNTGWNKFLIQPTLLEQGERYGWFVTTTGNHQLMTNSGNAYTGGSLFISSDGIWAQGSTTEDFTFRVNAAEFKSNRVVVPFESLTLEGGMSEIDMIYKKWAPAATSLIWEVKAQGDDEWVPMDARDANPLENLPPLVQLRAVFIGTPDVAPMIFLDNYARALAGRLRTDMTAISQLQAFGFTTDSAQIVLNMDNYSAASHTCVPKLVLADDTEVTADSVVETVDPTKPSRTEFVANFTLPANTPSARVRIEATTNSVINVPFGQDVQLNAF